jgi:hypothetical protein
LVHGATVPREEGIEPRQPTKFRPRARRPRPAGLIAAPDTTLAEFGEALLTQAWFRAFWRAIDRLGHPQETRTPTNNADPTLPASAAQVGCGCHCAACGNTSFSNDCGVRIHLLRYRSEPARRPARPACALRPLADAWSRRCGQTGSSAAGVFDGQLAKALPA